MSRDLDDTQRTQEAQYEYPYHHLPRVEDGHFTQVQYWSWGLQYLGGMEVVMDQLAMTSFDSVLDVGCGDGRFLRELRDEYPDVEVLGVDNSERSVALANAMNTDIEYISRDILAEQVEITYDVVTAIEVLEHIEPADLERFLEAIEDALADGGLLVLTVPHANKPVSEKHYQHFDGEALTELLTPRFENLELIPFDRQSLFFEGLKLLLGWRGDHYVINTPAILDRMHRLYRTRYLYAESEADCRRIAAVARKPS